jgi:hypothetical protein
VKSTTRLLLAAAVVWITTLSCTNQNQREEQLARQYCGSCHLFPEASLLPKRVWAENVLPQMALRMGVDFGKLVEIPEADRPYVLPSLPASAMVSEEEWKAIQNYFQRMAPDSLNVPPTNIADTLQQFDAATFSLAINGHPTTTMVKVDTVNDRVFISDRRAVLHEFDTRFQWKASHPLSSPPSQLLLSGKEDPLLVQMGIMDPNDQALGSIAQWHEGTQTFTTLIDSLQRPVYLEHVDMNQDEKKDFVICSFGNYTGSLNVYETLDSGKYKRHILQNVPGSRKVVVRDFDNNGLPDVMALMTQGDERIILLLNQGNFRFRIITLLRFPPVYGSSYFDVVDFNHDGKMDILYVNGDNADYSVTLKPYHGVRIFLNDGSNRFTESWFYPLNGACQAKAADFDKDGDLDIVATAFFADYQHHPEQSFVYFENTGHDFKPSVTRLAAQGRWITIEIADLDHDRDDDVVMGALDFPATIPSDLVAQWMKRDTWVLLLRNKLH